MSTVVEKHEPSYAYANLSFSRISNADLMGEVNAWKTAEMEIVCIGGSSGEGAQFCYRYTTLTVDIVKNMWYYRCIR